MLQVQVAARHSITLFLPRERFATVHIVTQDCATKSCPLRPKVVTIPFPSFKPRLPINNGTRESVAVASGGRKAMAIQRGGHSRNPLREGWHRRAGWGLALFQKRNEAAVTNHFFFAP